MRWLPIRSVFSACAMLRFEGHEFRDFVLQRSSLISQLANFLQQDADLARECLAEVVEVLGRGTTTAFRRHVVRCEKRCKYSK